MRKPAGLSEKSIAVRQLIATGHSYNQIADAYDDITYVDIFAAADDALRLNDLWMEHAPKQDYEQRLAEIKARHPKAYERWTDSEDRELSVMYAGSKSMMEMSSHFGRQPSAIRSRLVKLGLVSR